MTHFPALRLVRPGELVSFLVKTNIVLFITSLLIAPAAVNYTLGASVFLSPSTNVLFKLGASGTLPVFTDDRWWTLITANYLHGSLLHLIFNVLSLSAIGNITIGIYGPTRLFIVYFAGGIAAMAGSSLAGISLTLGASGAICALLGAMSYDDWRANKGNFKGRIKAVGVWVVFIALTGLTLPNVNNWAHAIGFASGFALGWAVWPRTTGKDDTLFRYIAGTYMLLTIVTLSYGLLFS